MNVRAWKLFFCIFFMVIYAVSNGQNAGELEVINSDANRNAIYAEMPATVPTQRSAVFGRNLGFGGSGVIGYGFTGIQGIAASPEAEGRFAGHFTGDVYVSLDLVVDGTINGTMVGTSDFRLKKDILNSSYGLDQLMQLRSVDFLYKNDEIPNLNHPKGLQTGFIAQEMEKVFPNLVFDNVVSVANQNDPLSAKKSSQYKGVNYVGLIPVLVKGIQEQQEIINSLEIEISELKEIINRK